MLVSDRAQPVDAVGRADPVGVEVLGVAVGGHDLLPRVERVVHAGHEVALQEVIGVEDDIALIGIDAEVAPDVLN